MKNFQPMIVVVLPCFYSRHYVLLIAIFDFAYCVLLTASMCLLLYLAAVFLPCLRLLLLYLVACLLLCLAPSCCLFCHMLVIVLMVYFRCVLAFQARSLSSVSSSESVFV